MMPEPAPRPETAEGKEDRGVRGGNLAALANSEKQQGSSHQRIINNVVERSSCVQGRGEKKDDKNSEKLSQTLIKD